MPIAHRYVEGLDLILTVWDGVVAPDEWEDAIDRQLVDPKWAGGRYRLADARTSDTSHIVTDVIEGITKSVDAAAVDVVGVKLAIVANADWAKAQEIDNTMRRVGITTVVFNDVHTACAWLGVDIDVVSRALAELRDELRTRAAEDPEG